MTSIGHIRTPWLALLFHRSYCLTCKMPTGRSCCCHLIHLLEEYRHNDTFHLIHHLNRLNCILAWAGREIVKTSATLGVFSLSKMENNNGNSSTQGINTIRLHKDVKILKSEGTDKSCSRHFLISSHRAVSSLRLFHLLIALRNHHIGKVPRQRLRLLERPLKQGKIQLKKIEKPKTNGWGDQLC